MGNGMELQQVIYNVLRAQIQFGTYSYGERLPTIEEAAHLFLVSVKTIRGAYRRLQRDGYITVSKSVGVKVSVQYSRQETESNIQQYFAERRDAMRDLGWSMRPLFGNAQWLSFKNASQELLAQLDHHALPKESMAPYVMIQQLQRVYGTLENDLLMRLIWQVFMFFLVPFLSVSGCLSLLNQNRDPALQMTALCREQDWMALRVCIDAYQDQKGAAFCQFYESRIKASAPARQAVFTWSSYEKASQLCYSLGMELLIAISQGVYPAGSLLPSLNTLAREKHVSVNTVRRTMALLNGVGAAKSINGVGTRVLPPEEIAENCDLSQPSVQERLFSYSESVHILALSCRQAAEATVSSMDQQTAEKWKSALLGYARTQRHDLTPYAIIHLISQDAPYMAVRTVYEELFRHLFWGYPLRSLQKDFQSYRAFYVPYLEYFLACLERSDADAFSTKLEELMRHEIRSIVDQLTSLGVGEAAVLVLDE